MRWIEQAAGCFMMARMTAWQAGNPSVPTKGSGKNAATRHPFAFIFGIGPTPGASCLRGGHASGGALLIGGKRAATRGSTHLRGHLVRSSSKRKGPVSSAFASGSEDPSRAVGHDTGVWTDEAGTAPRPSAHGHQPFEATPTRFPDLRSDCKRRIDQPVGPLPTRRRPHGATAGWTADGATMFSGMYRAACSGLFQAVCRSISTT